MSVDLGPNVVEVGAGIADKPAESRPACRRLPTADELAAALSTAEWLAEERLQRCDRALAEVQRLRDENRRLRAEAKRARESAFGAERRARLLRQRLDLLDSMTEEEETHAEVAQKDGGAAAVEAGAGI